MTDEDIFIKVRKCMAETFAISEGKISLDSNLVDNFGAESLDLLDLVFRLEGAFRVQLTRGEIEGTVKNATRDEGFEEDGILTDAALEQLRKMLPESEDKIRKGLRQQDIMSLFTVETFCKIVKRKLQET